MIYIESFKKVKALEYHSHSALEVSKNFFVPDVNERIVNNDRTFVVGFKAVDASKKSGFTGSALADNAEDLTIFNVDIYSLQYFGFVKSFFDVFYLYHG